MVDMTNAPTLAERLRALRGDDPEWTRLYDEVVRNLRAHGVGSGAPTVGQRFPDFALPDITGTTRRLGDLLAGGPLVISFNRGEWCPYCRAEIAAWADCGDMLSAAGARLVVISGEVGGRMGWIADLIGDRTSVLCDVDQGLALALGLAFRCAAPLREALLREGIDFADIYDNEGWILPIPATYALDAEGRVRFAYTEADFCLRAEPEEVIAALAGR